LEESYCGLIEVLSQNLSALNTKTQKDLRQKSWRCDRYSNQDPPEQRPGRYIYIDMLDEILSV
jgi:hypothetical protein